MKTIVSVLFIAIILIMPGCNIISQKPDQLAGVDIADAVYLGVDDPGHADYPDNNLLKLTSPDFSAAPDPLYFKDTEGEIFDDRFIEIEASDVITLTQKYILLFGGFTYTLLDGEHYSSALVVNTENGAVYDLEDRYRPDVNNYYLGSKYHQTDADGNIYYMHQGVSRLVPGDDGSLQYELYMDYYEGLMYDQTFFVDKHGNVFFESGTQVKLASGGIIDAGEEMFYFNGFDGKTIGLTYMNNADQKAYYITAGDGEINKTLFADHLGYTESFFDSWLFSSEEQLAHFLVSYSQGIDEGGEITYILGLAVFENDSSVYYIMPPSELEVGTILGIEDNYLWVENPDGLFALDLLSYNLSTRERMLHLASYTQFEIPENYELQQVRFDRQGVVEFVAYNFGSEERGKGFISMENGFQFIDDNSDLGTVDLTRIR